MGTQSALLCTKYFVLRCKLCFFFEMKANTTTFFEKIRIAWNRIGKLLNNKFECIKKAHVNSTIHKSELLYGTLQS